MVALASLITSPLYKPDNSLSAFPVKNEPDLKVYTAMSSTGEPRTKRGIKPIDTPDEHKPYQKANKAFFEGILPNRDPPCKATQGEDKEKFSHSCFLFESF